MLKPFVLNHDEEVNYVLETSAGKRIEVTVWNTLRHTLHAIELIDKCQKKNNHQIYVSMHED